MTMLKIAGIILVITGLWFIVRGLRVFISYRNWTPQTETKTISYNISTTPIFMRAPNFSAEEIFKYRNPKEATQSGNSGKDEYILMVTGDVIPARSVNTVVSRKNNFKFPFEKTADFLKSADIVFINLETPLFPGCKLTDEGMSFCGSDKNAEGLIYTGITVAGLANNHAGNYGNSGLDKTVTLLEKNGIKTTGLGSPAIVPIRDKKFGLLDYNDIEKRDDLKIASAESKLIKKDIADLKDRTDFIIVMFHWGIEYTSTPSARQKELAHESIDDGADLVLGNHPHWVQGVVVYKGKLITYAHGNFIFDQMWSQETREGVIGRYVFDEDGLIHLRRSPGVNPGVYRVPKSSFDSIQ